MNNRRNLLIFSCMLWSWVVVSFCLGQPPKPLIKVHFLNVGYADCFLLQLPDNQFVLIDAGDQAARPAILDYLARQGVRELQEIVLTHPHKNHFGAIDKILKTMKVGRFSYNGDTNGEEGFAEVLSTLKSQSIPIQVLREADTRQYSQGNIEIHILNSSSLDGSTNNNALVLWLKYGAFALLLFSDVEPEQQERIFNKYPFLKETPVVTIPHHGGPISAAFKNFFLDKTFIISTGANPWGFPQDAQIQPLKGKIFRTDHNGHIIVESDGVSWKVTASP